MNSVTRSRVLLAGLLAGTTMASVAVVGVLANRGPGPVSTPVAGSTLTAPNGLPASTPDTLNPGTESAIRGSAALAPYLPDPAPATEFVYPNGSIAPPPGTAGRTVPRFNDDDDDGRGRDNDDDRREVGGEQSRSIFLSQFRLDDNGILWWRPPGAGERTR